MTEPYRPVNCEFHDVLEAAAVRRQPVVIVHLDEAGARAELRDRIVDLTARDGVEFMHLEGGAAVRLDRIVSVDGVALAAFPSPD